MRKFALVFAMLTFSNAVLSATLIGADQVILNTDSVTLEIASGVSVLIEPGEPLSLLHNVYVSGDLFLDYSLFSNNHDLSLSSATYFVAANAISIFAYSDTPTMPEDFSSFVYSSTTLDIDADGSWAIFGQSPISGGYFEAGGNLYIGNYSSIAPIPIPPAFALFLSGLLVPLALRVTTKINQQQSI